MPAEDFICPACGTAVPAGAAACPECGSDENTGWSDQTIYDGTGIKDPADFDRADYERREAGKSGLPVWVRIIAVILIAALVWLFLAQ